MHANSEEAHSGLSRNEYAPYFQPIVTLRTGIISGFEVLARGVRSDASIAMPDDFIPIAERDGWIGELMEQVFRKAFASVPPASEPFALSVNISPVQLQNLGLPQQILELSRESGFALDRLIIEITETALMSDVQTALAIAAELKSLGCRLALDDFGTGYSSLRHLQALPFDELKVDRSFVQTMTQDRESRKIVAAVVGLGQSLGLTTVAEGVETREQAEMLLWMGCDMAQGWLYGRPVPATELDGILKGPPQKISVASPNSWATISVSSLDAQPAQRLAQLQAVYDGAPVALGFLDRTHRYVNLNRRLADMNGAPVEEHLGRDAHDMMPNLFPQLQEDINRARAGEAITGVEVTEPAAGALPERTCLLSYQPARDESGEVVGVSVAMVDITKRKLAEDALRESEDHYRHMVQLHPQRPWIMDPEGAALDVSPRWESTTVSPRELTRDPGWLASLHPDDSVATVSAIATSRQRGEAIDVEYRIINSEGGWRWMRSRGAPRYDVAGRIVCWYGSVEDIDERKQVEEKLKTYEIKFGTLS